MEIFAYLHPYLHPRKMAEIRHLMEIMEIMEISTSLNEIKTHPIIYYIEGVMSFYLHIPIISIKWRKYAIFWTGDSMEIGEYLHLSPAVAGHGSNAPALVTALPDPTLRFPPSKTPWDKREAGPAQTPGTVDGGLNPRVSCDEAQIDRRGSFLATFG